MGFYGNEEASLFGKKDNVRKFWEDMVLKTYCRPFIEDFLRKHSKITILDLGVGAVGKGIELLTHIPPSNPKEMVNKNFVLLPIRSRSTDELHISPAMITQGRANYRGKNNFKFEYANLEEGLPPAILNHEPFNIYFSSYGALSHLEPDTLESLFRQISLTLRKILCLFLMYTKIFQLSGPYTGNQKKNCCRIQWHTFTIKINVKKTK